MSDSSLPAADPAEHTAASALAAARRIVVKIGSSLLIDPASRGVAREWLTALATELAAFRRDGREVIVVFSGSVALGRGRLGDIGRRVHDKQAAAAGGQRYCMNSAAMRFVPASKLVEEGYGQFSALFDTDQDSTKGATA